MVEVLYGIEYPFQAKTFEAVHPHVDAEAGYLPLRPGAKGCSDAIPEVEVSGPPGYANRHVREVDPNVVVYNHTFRYRATTFHREYPLVHLRHGASIGRGTAEVDVDGVFRLADAALAPGDRWAETYRETPGDLRVETVGVPEADPLVGAEPPREKRVLYAPTNTRYGEGCLLNTAEDVLDLFADTDYHLVFRPHPHDALEVPARSLVRRCRDRVCDMSNVTYDDDWSPVASLLDADLLLSDYSGTVTEWLHTGRPLVQFSNVVSEANEVPRIGHVTEDLTLEAVDDLYRDGLPPDAAARRDDWLDRLGVPMDGRAGKRAARAIESYVG